MLGLVFVGDRQLELREFADPEPGPEEVVVAIKASGLCGSDLHLYRSDPAAPATQPLIRGHEPAGIVEAVGLGVSPQAAAVGDRVMVHHYSGCGRCNQCRSGWPQMCDVSNPRIYGVDQHGAHASHMVVPATTLVSLDDSLSFTAGAAIGCGTGTAWGGLDRLGGDLGGATVAVFGQGPVGLSATMLATARGAKVIAVDISGDRLATARRFGATETVDPTEMDSARAIQDLTGGKGASFVLETSGSVSASTSALESLAKWGTACMIGLGGSVSFSPDAYLRRQITVRTSWSMSSVQQAECAAFISENQLPVDELFSHRWSLEDATDAYTEFDRQTSGKAAFIF
ncbi:zinc-binding dehydrogenase [Rhodococcus opacus]|uniref:zinc-dependent alcohol dehydrogenase family protein n=1 Tax=Rhodococcus opacus TaxID=37919 RepID=UPI00146D560D|nr:zinc-binding dehydrogenase [Rhodococcus opacus]MDV7090793.1 zinc-binding dehydrogenase [Rhodococcus opacus]WKN60213.1 zinc-binding dehydrogenase [Rhodococcus opacus]